MTTHDNAGTDTERPRADRPGRGDGPVPVPMHDRSVLMTQARRMLDLHRAGTTTMAEEEHRVPVAVFSDPERFERERRRVFRTVPLVAGLSCELDGPGSFTTFSPAGVPIVLVRDDDGSLGAFLNVCRHRGAQVVEGSGCGRRLTCPYHAWSYGTDGTLVGIPGAEGFTGVDRSTHGLVRVPCEERHGIMFVVADPEGTLDLDEWLGPLDAELPHLGLDHLHHVGTRDMAAACNWHLNMDTNTESYHFSALHRDSIGPFTMSNLNVVEPFGRSQRLTFAACTLPDLAEQAEEDWEPDAHLQFVYLLFPNDSLLITGDHVELFRILPGDTVATSVTHQSYYARRPVVTEDERFLAEAQFDLFHGVVRDEDLPCAETIQRGIHSGANAHLTFGRNEPALHHLHREQAALLED